MLERTGIYLEPGQSIISSSNVYYKIIQFLGKGGNAIAFKVLCTSGLNAGLIFVLKIQYNLSTKMRRERFAQESAFLKDSTHPTILRHYDDGEYTIPSGNIFPFIVTNFLPDSLFTYMRDQTINFEHKVIITCQMLSALLFLQSKKILHRDIKPKNIFLSNNDAFLGDFGLIKDLNNYDDDGYEDDVKLLSESALADVVDLSGYIAMPKLYRTPELVEYANHRDVLRIESDIFQLGLVLAELYTGQNPLQEAANLTDPIIMNNLGYIDGTKHGGWVIKQLKCMLRNDYRQRPSINELLSSFTGLYQRISV